MVWNPFVKNKDVIQVEKSTALVTEKKSTFFPSNWLLEGGNSTNTYMTIKRALNFYDDAAPVATAIDWINDEFKTLKLVLMNDKKIETTADILTFLKQPNDEMTQEEFLEALGAYYLICNEVYIIASGDVTRPPAEIIPVSPEFVEPRRADDGFIGEFIVQRMGMNREVYRRDAKSYRFYNKERDSEIWQIKGFSALNNSLYSNSTVSNNGLTSSRGRSKLSSIHREINQYIEIGQHNLTMLDNGLLPSGTLTMPEGATLEDDQFERVRSQVVDYYSGAKNAGKVMILDNGMIFTPMGINPKDMDFEKLTKTVTMTIFNRYKVPLPLISPDNMTLANMDTAKLNLYDNCVTPLANRLFRELTIFLGMRFKLKENELICPDIDAIGALQPRRNEQLKFKKELEIFSTNELRLQMGVEKVKEGDLIYINSRLMPLGTDTPSLLRATADVAPQKLMKSLTTRKQFTAILQQQLDVKGNRVYSDLEIDDMATGEGL